MHILTARQNQGHFNSSQSKTKSTKFGQTSLFVFFSLRKKKNAALQVSPQMQLYKRISGRNFSPPL